MKKLFLFVLVAVFASSLHAETLEQILARKLSARNWRASFQAIKTDSNTWTGTQNFTGALTFDNDITLDNGEIIDNDTDGDVIFIYDDDAATLADFIVSSSVDTPNIADNDNMSFIFRWDDDSSGTTDWGEFVVTSLDVSDESEDSQIQVKVMTNGVQTTPVNFYGKTIAFSGGEKFDNDVSGQVALTANVFKHGYDAAAYWTATQADGGQVTLNSVSDGTAGFIISDNVQVNGAINYLGASNNVAGTDSFMVTPTYSTTLATGGIYTFKADTVNTGACVLGIAGVDTVSLKKLTDQDPGDNHIEANSMIMMIYDGTNMQIQTPAAN